MNHALSFSVDPQYQISLNSIN